MGVAQLSSMAFKAKIAFVALAVCLLACCAEGVEPPQSNIDYEALMEPSCDEPLCDGVCCADDTRCVLTQDGRGLCLAWCNGQGDCPNNGCCYEVSDGSGACDFYTCF